MTSGFNIRRAAAVCQAGGVIAYPTESVYGLGCDPFDQLAVFKILYLKKRPLEKGLILIASSIEQLEPLIDFDPENLRQQIAKAEKPTTWLVPPSDRVPNWITGQHDKLAVRITQHETARALCEASGFPLVSTSANKGGHAPAKNAFRVRNYFNDDLDFIVTGKAGSLLRPTEIRDLATNQVIRRG